MNDTIVEEQVLKIDSFNGIDVYKIRAEKFKTNSINVFFQDNLSRENVTKNALVPAVLRRGSKNFNTFQDLALYLEELYGASFDCGISKKGEQQIVHFYMDHISDKYTGSDEKLFLKCFNLIFEIITQPVLEDGVFKKDYLEQEKENLKKIIEGRINDKMQYSVERCLEETCKGEPFQIYEYGFIEDLPSIESKELFDHYQMMLESFPMKVFVAGDIDDAALNSVIQKLKGLKRRSVKSITPPKIEKQVGEVKEITESLNITQGKLSLGLRTNTRPDDKAYYALMVCNSILGGGIHSKLFQNVREKESLAYYSFSRLEKFKGLMVISSGIEIQNRYKALNIILKQLEEMKKGNISDYEYESSIKSIKTGLESLKDSQIQMVDYFLSQTITGTNDTLNNLMEKIKKVTRQDIKDVAQRISLDTIYFLTSQQG
jgi:predicted Zn-dependent peptidase